MDVIFTIVSRNYAAQAATLMESLSAAEPDARRVVIASDGPIPELDGRAEVIDATTLDTPIRAMSVYYDALELNTAIKPYVFLHFLGQPGVASVTYLDPDIYVFRPLDQIRSGLDDGQLVLTPHITRPLLGEANPNDQALLRAGVYNLGFASVRNEPKTQALIRWWADRCEFDCRVDLANGLFTDQKWMDLSPGFVDSVAILRDPGLNLAYWNLEGRDLQYTEDGWQVDGRPLTFFHFSGFDPHRPRTLSKHQNRVSVSPGSALADLLADFAQAMLRNGHAATSVVPYAHARFTSGRKVSALMRRRALRAARAGERFADGLGAATEIWFDSPDPEASQPGLPDVTRLMEQVWRENPGADPFDHDTVEGRLGFHQWFADNAEALGADATSLAAAQELARRSGGSAREADPTVWRDTPAPGAAAAFDWLREPVTGPSRATLALLAARRDLRERFAQDPDTLLAWCLGPEAAAGRFAVDLLPDACIAALARDPAPLFEAARLAERGAATTDLRRRLNAGFGAGERAGWPAVLTEPLRAPFLAPASGLPAPFVRLFLEIWEQRPDLQRLYPLGSFVGRLRYLRWLVAGGLAEYGVELAALSPRLRRHPLMRLAEQTVRRHREAGAARPSPPPHAATLLVVEDLDAIALPAGVLAYDAGAGRFAGPGGAVAPPRTVGQVCFLTAPGLVPADAIALHAKGVAWRTAVGVWHAAAIHALAQDEPALGFVDAVWTDQASGWRARPLRVLDPAVALDAALVAALRT